MSFGGGKSNNKTPKFTKLGWILIMVAVEEVIKRNIPKEKENVFGEDEDDDKNEEEKNKNFLPPETNKTPGGGKSTGEGDGPSVSAVAEIRQLVKQFQTQLMPEIKLTFQFQ